MRSIKMIAGATLASASLYIPSAWSVTPVVYSGSGANAATALDAFRAAIGGDRNNTGPEASGRREIGWDGVRLDGTDANPNTKWLTTAIQLSSPLIASRTRGRYSRIRMQ